MWDDHLIDSLPEGADLIAIDRDALTDSENKAQQDTKPAVRGVA